ncbi:hypothetical protein HID58_009185 [Brassica napus]|uniref:Uncharacterized protein n=1 Tax=Brassica napus TaxID=3708 RepID=A0ABQ8DRZ0_BRANA|nr:hypothetical protein HID58_009185 [Brassica napus]
MLWHEVKRVAGEGGWMERRQGKEELNLRSEEACGRAATVGDTEVREAAVGVRGVDDIVAGGHIEYS